MLTASFDSLDELLLNLGQVNIQRVWTLSLTEMTSWHLRCYVPNLSDY